MKTQQTDQTLFNRVNNIVQTTFINLVILDETFLEPYQLHDFSTRLLELDTYFHSLCTNCTRPQQTTD